MPARRARPTLADRAYAELKGHIISAKYLPGQFLQEARVCADLKMGRTPVRQALHRLHQEGLLNVIHRKGVIVRPDSLPELLLALEARILVEPFCAGRCADLALSTDIRQLEALHKKYLKRRGTGDRRALMEIDMKLHQIIGEVAGNKFLVEFLQSIQERTMRLWFSPRWEINDFSETAIEHEALLAAICARTADAATTAMRQHLISLKDRIISNNFAAQAFQNH